MTKFEGFLTKWWLYLNVYKYHNGLFSLLSEKFSYKKELKCRNRHPFFPWANFSKKANLRRGVARSSRARFFVLLRPWVAVPSRARARNYPTQQAKQRIVRGYSWLVLPQASWPKH